ncbi:MAG: tape measure protein [Acidobacteria bacterium]|nr:tape measure protein [Acidobacteriota bacterium]
MQTAGIGLTAALTAPLALIAKTGLAFDSMFEQASVAFSSMTGSVDIAHEHLTQLREFADRTPFEFADVIKGSKTFQAFGLSIEEVIPTLTAIGNAAAATGRGQVAIDQLTMSLGQMLARGKVTSTEFRELGNNAVPGLRILAAAAGKTTIEMQALVEKGVVPADWALRQIVKGIQKSNLGGMMEVQSRTAAGALSTLHDVVVGTLGDALQPVFGFLRDSLLWVIPKIQEFGKMWVSLPGPIKNTVVAIAGIGGVVGPVLVLLGGVVTAVGTIGAPILATIAGITAGVSAAVGAITFIWTSNFGGMRDAAIKIFNAINTGVQQIFGDLIQWYQSNLPLIQATTKTVFDFIQRIVSGSVGVGVKNTVSAIGYIVSFVRSYLANLATAITVIMKAINGDWRGAWFTFANVAGDQIDRLVRTMLGRLPAIFTKAYEMGKALVSGFSQGIASNLPSNPIAHSGSTSLRLNLPPTSLIPPRKDYGADLFSPLGGNKGRGGGGGGGAKEDEAASLLKRLQDEIARVGLKTKEQEVAVDLLDKKYAKYNETTKETIRLAARELDSKMRINELSEKTTALLDRQRQELRGTETEMDKVFELLRNQAAPVAIDSTTRSVLLLNASLIDGQKALEGLSKMKLDLPLSILPEEFGADIGGDTLERIRQEFIYAKAVEELNEKLKIKRTLSNLEQSQIEITTGKLKELTQAQKDQLLVVARGIDDQLKAKEKLDKLKEMAGQFTDVFKGAFDALFTDGFQGFKSKLLSGFADLLSQLVSQLLSSALIKLLGGLFGGLFGGGGNVLASIGGGGGGIFGSLFGGGRALGGPVFSGRSYLVGENGPELFVPRNSGSVVTNRDLVAVGSGGRSLNVTNNFWIPSQTGTISKASQRQTAARSGYAITRALERDR